MKRRFSYVTVEKAFKTILETTNLSSLDSETIPIREAYGRILAEEITSTVDVPPQAMSHFDGFALKAAGTNKASVRDPVYFKVIGRVFPGEKPAYEIVSGEACYVTTGALLPKGADSVVAVEATEGVTEDKIGVRAKVAPGHHVIPRGSDIGRGQTVFTEGHKLRSQDLSLLATLRIGSVKVVKKPRVAIICVGDELTDALSERKPGKVVNSLRYAISAMIYESGGVSLYGGIVSDHVERVRERIEQSLARADLVLVVGGSSMGEKDVTFEAVGAVSKPRVIIHGIKRKPGRVSGFAVIRNKPVILLPGLCHSMVVGFYTFAFPIILMLGGLSLVDSRLTSRAQITQPISFKSFIPFEHVIFVNVKRTQKGHIADPCFGESSSFSVLVNANAFIIVPANKTTVNAGEEVEVCLLPSFFSLKDVFITNSWIEGLEV